MTNVLSFKKSFAYSISAHLAAILLALIINWAFHFAHKGSSGTVEVIKASVRVDVVAMPKMSIQELKKMTMEDVTDEPSEEGRSEKEDIKPEDLVEEVKVKKKSFTSLLADYSKKDVIKKKPGTTGVELAGNKTSSGAAIVGDRSDGPGSPFSIYVQGLPDIIRPRWTLPSFLKDQNLQCRIKIFISATGQLLRTEVYESSGNDDYDQRAIAAIKRSAPFPVPEKDAAKFLAVKGLILGFPL
jgi:colicin import membrane protein